MTTTDFNVDQWIKLAKDNPEAFEAKRMRWIQQTITIADPKFQPRLKGLQFEIDAMRKTVKDQKQLMISLAQKTLEKLKTLREAYLGNIPDHSCHEKAKVLAFKKQEVES